MELEEQTISSSEVVIPIPQIVYIEGEGRNSSLSVNGDFTLIRSEYYPQGRTIFVYGDVTATPN